MVMELQFSSWRINSRGSQTWLTFTDSNYGVITCWSWILHNKRFFSLCYDWTRLWILIWKVGTLAVKAKRVCLSRYGNQSVMTPAYFNKQRSTMSNILDQHRPPEELVKQWHSHLGGTILVKVIYSIGRVGSLAYIYIPSLIPRPQRKPGVETNMFLGCFVDVSTRNRTQGSWAWFEPPVLWPLSYDHQAATSPSLYTVQVVLSHTWQALSIIMLSDS